MTPDYLRSRFIYCDNVSAYRLRNTKNKLVLPQPRIDYLERSFFVQQSSVVEQLTCRPKTNIFTDQIQILGRVRLGYSGISIYSRIYSGYSAPGNRIAGMEIHVFRNENSSRTNAYSHHSNYSYSRLMPNERALN